MKYKMRKYLNGQVKDLHPWKVKRLMEDEEETLKFLKEYVPEFMKNIIDPDIEEGSIDKYLNNLSCGRLGDFDNRYIIVAYDKHEPIGIIIALPIEDKNSYHILTVGVKEEYRKKGVGSRLMATCINDMFIRGVNDLIIDVYVLNTAAVSLYKKFGFERIDKDYYPNNNEEI